MEQRIHRGALSGREEFFYPDMPVGHLPQGLRLAMPRNGRPGVQLLLETDAGQLDASLESDAFVPEFFLYESCTRGVQHRGRQRTGRRDGSGTASGL